MSAAENNLTERMERAAADFESASAFIKSVYFERGIHSKVFDAVQAALGPWLDRSAAAAYVRCSVSEIDRAAGLGFFKTYRLGAGPRFKKSELDAAITDGRWGKAQAESK